MQWITRKGSRVGVEGDFYIDAEDGHLRSDDENLIHIGLIPGQWIMANGGYAKVGDSSCGGTCSERVIALLHPHTIPAGPVGRIFPGRIIWHEGDKEI